MPNTVHHYHHGGGGCGGFLGLIIVLSLIAAALDWLVRHPVVLVLIGIVVFGCLFLAFDERFRGPR